MINNIGKTKIKIGVLALQGSFAEHIEHIKLIGVQAKLIKYADELADLAGLIIPGGESTCMYRLLKQSNLDRAIRIAYTSGLKIWGTCAGAILLANNIINDMNLTLFKFIDITIIRNAFGSQLNSFSDSAYVPVVSQKPVPLTFIRAPQISKVGPDVKILLQMENYIAAAENNQILVTIFHPELNSDLSFHQYFARKCIT